MAEGVFQCFFSEHLPIRLEAAMTMSKLLEIQVVENFVKPSLNKILESYLVLMEDIDSEELMSAL